MNNQKNDATISLCMIVKNEEKYLPDCLSSIKEVVDQIVILDTGSTDNTINIANSFEAEVYQFDWRDDFSLARNESIKYAKCDWIFWMDADEILDPDSIPDLMRCINAKDIPLYYKVMIRSRIGDGKSVHDSEAHRLFSNHFGIKFQNRIHEQISYSAHKIGAEEKISSILLHHKGYDENELNLDDKLLRNRKLLTKMVEESPNDAYANFTLAQNYGQAKEWKLMIHHLEKALEIGSLAKPMKVSLYNMLAEGNIHLGNWDIIEKYINNSMELEPIQSGCHYIEYRLAEYQEDYNRGLSSLEILLDNTKYLQNNPKKISSDTLISLSEIHKAIAQTLIKLDDKPNALINYQLAWNESNDIKFLPKIIGCAKEVGDWETVVEYLEIYVDKIGITAESLDVYGLALINLNRFQEALNIYLELIQMDPNEVGVIKVIAGLYAKLGDTENAQNWVIVLNQLQSKA